MWKTSAEENLAREIFRKSKEAVDGEAIKDVRENSKKATKVRIEVPWGHIAGKWWGPKNVRPILCVHGLLDNLGTFETLIPLLPQEFAYLAIDLPGHGFSSPIPHGMIYTSYDYIWIVKRIQEIYKWEKISIIGHSIGAISAFVYAALFPDRVDFVVALDGLKPIIEDNIIEYMKTLISNVVKEDLKNQNPGEPLCYSIDEIVRKNFGGYNPSVPLEFCPYIVSRNVRKSTIHLDKYYVSRDRRLDYFKQLLISQESSLLLAKSINIPFLYFKIKNSTTNFNESEKNLLEVIEEMKKNNSNFFFHEITGIHHEHLCNPIAIAGIITDFLQKYYKITEPVKGNL